MTGEPRNVEVIDAFGFSADELRTRYQAIYQRLHDRVKPERDVDRMDSVRERWWLRRRLREDLRGMLKGLPRHIATVETAKHRTFQFLDASILPDNRLIAIALNSCFSLGVLSSSVHQAWALAVGGTSEDRLVYNKTTCLETVPFPAEGTGLTPELCQEIASLSERIDGNRKIQQAEHPGLTLTGM